MLNSLLLTGYEFLTALLPFFLLFWGYARRCRGKGLALSRTETAAMLLFGCYIAAAFCFTGAGTLSDLLRFGLAPHPEKGNLVPFSGQIDWVGYFLNVLLFVPFGAMLPFLCREAGKWQNILLAGLSFSLLIELSQFLSRRSAGIDDLILNTLGALAGYGLFLLFRRLAGGRQAPARRGRGELLLACAVLFAGHFFLFDELGVAGLFHGF